MGFYAAQSEKKGPSYSYARRNQGLRGLVGQLSPVKFECPGAISAYEAQYGKSQHRATKAYATQCRTLLELELTLAHITQKPVLRVREHLGAIKALMAQ